MKSIEFKKRRGIIIDMFNVLCLYSRSASLDAIYKHYKIEIDPDICESYALLYQFIDENVKDLKPLFGKSPNALSDGSIMYKLIHSDIVQETVFFEDIISMFKKMKWDYFIAEVFRLTEAQPESERNTYLNIVHNRSELGKFLDRQNYTVRENRAIRRYVAEAECGYINLIRFFEKLYSLVEHEHKRHERKLMMYYSWLQSQLIKNTEGFIYDGSSAFEHLRSRMTDIYLIVTVGLFPPYTVQLLEKNDIVLTHFGYGSYTDQIKNITEKRNRLKKGYSKLRYEIIALLEVSPMRLCDLATALNTSNADISYHISVLENNGYIKRVRINGYEHFSLRENSDEHIT